MTTINIQAIQSYLLELQTKICNILEEEDGQQHFRKDEWQKPEGGFGLTCALENGKVIEKAGVNFSYVKGDKLPSAATTQFPELINSHFQALGVSIIIHPLNPYAPTCHFNVRFFMAEKPEMEPIWWFGGGFDLTPYYGFEDDCVHWHRMAKSACEPFGNELYPRLKRAADEYFYLKHRQEPRGIGGIFFDNYREGGFENCFAFMKSVGDHFMQAYQPILAKRKNTSYGESERQFQQYRRGRYVEYNLLYDRGTLFGLQFGGRIESILISLPPHVSWRYDWQPAPGSAEEELTKKYLIPRDWV